MANTLRIFISVSVLFQTLPNATELKVTKKDASISFNDVTFGYLPDKSILDGLSFTVPAGKTVAIVGGSGSG